MAGQIFVASTSSMFDFGGQRVMVVEGRTTAREGHPILQERGELFRPLVPDFEVEEPAPPRRGRPPRAAADLAGPPADPPADPSGPASEPPAGTVNDG